MPSIIAMILHLQVLEHNQGTMLGEPSFELQLCLPSRWKDLSIGLSF